MKIAIPKERRPDEARVAASPDTVKKYVGMGQQVTVETGAGLGSSFTDEAYQAAGATIAKSAKEALADADIVMKVQRPMTADEGTDEVGMMKSGAVVIASLSALTQKAAVEAYAKKGLTCFAMELVPRITRAQSMDILSSQANLAGYRAVIEGAYEFGRGFPMMMTAAGTVAPARVLVMGAGVAGLQAVATAKRLGAVVYAFDVRAAAKEQVESLGGKFIEVDAEAAKAAETAGGYAKEMGEDYKRKQAEKITEALEKTDIAITTALIPGKPAPVLITEEQVKKMKPGSVIVDLAVEMGGNCPLSEKGKVVVKHGVKFVGHANLPSRIAADASSLYAKNILNFMGLLVDKETKGLKINLEDEIIKGTLVCKDGQIVHPGLTG